MFDHFEHVDEQTGIEIFYKTILLIFQSYGSWWDLYLAIKELEVSNSHLILQERNQTTITEHYGFTSSF